MTSSSSVLNAALNRTFSSLRRAREAFEPELIPHEIGVVTNVATGIATISGLPGVGYEELVSFGGGLLGIAFNIDEDEVGVILLGDFQGLHAGAEAKRTFRVMDVAVERACWAV